MEIRRIEPGDENWVSNLIRKTISISNIKDYPKELMDALIAIETPEHVLERASWTHFYVVIDKDEIIGCGAIGPYWGKEDESSLFTIFVLPDYQGKGLGKILIQNAIENSSKIIYLDCWAGNDKLKTFYKSNGFNYLKDVKEKDYFISIFKKE